MTLYQKLDDEFVELSEADEAMHRKDATKLFSNDSGYEIMMPDQDAAALKAEWAANAATAAEEAKKPKPLTLEQRIAKLEALEQRVAALEAPKP